MEHTDSKESSMRDYLRVIFRYKLVIVISIIIVIVASYINQQFKVQKYIASTRILVSGYYQDTDQDLYKKLLYGRGIIAQHANGVNARSVIERVVIALRLHERPLDEELTYSSPLRAAILRKSIDEMKEQLAQMNPEQRERVLFDRAYNNLKSNIGTSLIEDANMFEINVTDINPRMATMIVNALSQSYLIQDLGMEVNKLQLVYGDKYSTVIQLKDYIRGLNEKMTGKLMPDLEAQGPGSIKIINQSEIAHPVGSNSLFTMSIAFFMSIFLGVLLAFIIDYLDYSLKTPQEIERHLSVPVLCSIPKRKRKSLLISETNPRPDEYSLAIKSLSEQCHMIMKEKGNRIFLISGFEATDDASIIAANLGYSLSHDSGYKVLIIDANLRSPSISSIFDIPDSPGLVDVIREDAAFELAVKDIGSGLHVLPSRKPTSNQVIYLDSSTMIGLLNYSREVYDMVLLSCADLKSYPDAVILSSKVDGTILIINEGRTNWQVAKKLISPLINSNNNIIGAILNNRTYVIPEVVYKWF